MAPDKIALVPSDGRQYPPESPTFRRSTRVRKSAMLTHFFSPKVSRSGEGAHSPHSRVVTTARARGPVDPPTRAERPCDRQKWCVIPHPNPARSPRPHRVRRPEFRNDFPVTTRVSNPKNTAFRPGIDLVVAPPFLRLRARRASKGRSPTTIPPPGGAEQLLKQYDDSDLDVLDDESSSGAMNNIMRVLPLPEARSSCWTISRHLRFPRRPRALRGMSPTTPVRPSTGRRIRARPSNGTCAATAPCSSEASPSEPRKTRTPHRGTQVAELWLRGVGRQRRAQERRRRPRVHRERVPTGYGDAFPPRVPVAGTRTGGVLCENPAMRGGATPLSTPATRTPVCAASSPKGSPSSRRRRALHARDDRGRQPHSAIGRGWADTFRVPPRKSSRRSSRRVEISSSGSGCPCRTSASTAGIPSATTDVRPAVLVDQRPERGRGF